jgi:hypothetical protein
VTRAQLEPSLQWLRKRGDDRDELPAVWADGMERQ